MCDLLAGQCLSLQQRRNPLIDVQIQGRAIIITNLCFWAVSDTADRRRRYFCAGPEPKLSWTYEKNDIFGAKGGSVRTRRPQKYHSFHMFNLIWLWASPFPPSPTWWKYMLRMYCLSHSGFILMWRQRQQHHDPGTTFTELRYCPARQSTRCPAAPPYSQIGNQPIGTTIATATTL